MLVLWIEGFSLSISLSLEWINQARRDLVKAEQTGVSVVTGAVEKALSACTVPLHAQVKPRVYPLD